MIKKLENKIFKKEGAEGDLALYKHGLGYKPCIVVKLGKRKSLLRFNDEEKWVSNKSWVFVGDDIKFRTEILRLLKKEVSHESKGFNP